MSNNIDWVKVGAFANICTAFTPIIVLYIGMHFTNLQSEKDESQKKLDRIVNYAKTLSSDNPDEQVFAMMMLKNEKKSYQKEVPYDLIAFAVPQLMNLAKATPDITIANQAKQLAIILSENANSNIADFVKNTVEKQSARIYFHIQDVSQQPEADDDSTRMQEKLGRDYVIPSIKHVHVGPKNTELRYFRLSDKDEALRILTALEDSGIDAKVQYVKRPEIETRPRHFELWYGEFPPKTTTP